MALGETLLALLGSPDLADKRWVTQQYDAIVRGNTVLAMPEDGGLLRIDEETGLGIALATDGNGRYCLLDPYQGTQLALAEAYRNVAMTGARPVAVTNCLNFGSPEDPEVMWQLAEAVRGLADGCKTLGIPVTGGNVSLYNQTGSNRHPPHPGDRRARRPRRRSQAARRRLPGRRGAGRAARHDQRGVRRLGVGRGRPQASGRAPAGRRSRRRAEPRRSHRRRRRGRRAGQRPRPLRRRPGDRPGGVLPARRRRLLDQPRGLRQPRGRGRGAACGRVHGAVQRVLRAARSSRSRLAAKTSSPTCATRTGCRRRCSAVPEARR